MGVDLTLLPYWNNNCNFAHTLLDLERRRELWDEIEKLKQCDVSTGFSSYVSRVSDGTMKDEKCYGVVDETPYGEPLRYTIVGELLQVASHVGVTDNWKNRAAWAFLARCPTELKVALYWH